MQSILYLGTFSFFNCSHRPTFISRPNIARFFTVYLHYCSTSFSLCFVVEIYKEMLEDCRNKLSHSICDFALFISLNLLFHCLCFSFELGYISLTWYWADNIHPLTFLYLQMLPVMEFARIIFQQHYSFMAVFAVVDLFFWKICFSTNALLF